MRRIKLLNKNGNLIAANNLNMRWIVGWSMKCVGLLILIMHCEARDFTQQIVDALGRRVTAGKAGRPKNVKPEF